MDSNFLPACGEMVTRLSLEFQKLISPTWEPALTNFVDFDSKWVDSETFPAIHPALIDEPLKNEISRIALETYAIMDCRDYARVDIREKGGNLFVLDVNPNPSLFPGSGFARSAAVAGLSYSQMAKRLVDLAWMHKTWRKNRWTLIKPIS
jgi:D-alanine-D-alanine ligase